MISLCDSYCMYIHMYISGLQAGSPHQPFSLWHVGVCGVAVEEVGDVGGIVMLPANELDQISVGHRWRHLSHPE